MDGRRWLTGASAAGFAVALATGGLVVSGSVTNPAAATPPGRIGGYAWVSDRAGSRDIWFQRLVMGGSTTLRVTDDPGTEGVPAVSPVDDRLAYAADVYGDFDLFLTGSDFSGRVMVASTTAHEDQPSWSPDGTSIVFTSDRDGDFDLYRYDMSPTGGNVTQLTDAPGADLEPDWSPDGTRIVFTSTRAGDSELFVMNADGTAPAQLTHDHLEDASPSWAPDSDRIAWSSAGDIWATSLSSTFGLRLTDDPAHDGDPSWSADPGGGIIFTSNRSGTLDVFSMNTDGDVEGPVGDAADPVAWDGQPAYQSALADLTRLWGADRVETAIAVSQARFGALGAGAVVLSRSDFYADALAGTPLAVAASAPILLTPTASLDYRVATELARVLAAGSTVYLLGGEVALSATVAQQVANLGYAVVRLAGEDRYATAVAIARDGPTNPAEFFVASGLNFPDALVAGPPAALRNGAVLLTRGAEMPAATAAFLASKPLVPRVAIGDAAIAADPGASLTLRGDTRYATAVVVAQHYWPAGFAVALASGENFPDALSGGAHIGAGAPFSGPLVLVGASTLPAEVEAYLRQQSPAFAFAYGGPVAVSDAVLAQAQMAMSGR